MNTPSRHSLSSSLCWLFCASMVLCSFLCLQCSQAPPPTLQLISAAESGLDFRNEIAFTDSLNVLSYMYFFNGGGVAVGDVNQDGLEDVFFTANQSSNRLYLNRGDFRFEDITEASGLLSKGWSSGVSMVDINADGWLDIYVCRTANPKGHERANLLYINQGNLQFEEQAAAYGLADTAYSTQAAFFDYDLDGDLDVYLLNHAHQFSGTNDPLPKKTQGQAAHTDKLLRNDWNERAGHPVFSDVSKPAGIQIEGFGLGVAISDLNQDGWPDIYVSNDFISNDLLYINQQDGSFRNEIHRHLAHQSHNGMGTDIADYNNDGWSDILVADMLPESHARRKRMMTNTTFDVFSLMIFMGYEAQYTRNTLQLHRGNSPMLFSEIGQLAGIHATDWSWSPLLVDLDLDAHKDLLVSNGYLKDLTDLDAIVYRKQRSVFTTQAERDSLYLDIVRQLPGIHLPNFLYQNQGNLRFEDVSASWGFQHPTYSHGVAYSDLDLDGDLDLVVNNTQAPADLYQNTARHSSQKAAPHFLQIDFQGPPQNPLGIGAKVWVCAGGQTQYFEQFLTRGYQSSVSPRLTVGLGTSATVDSVRVSWPDGRQQLLVRLKADQVLLLDYANSEAVPPQLPRPTPSIWQDRTQALGLNYVSEEILHVDFKLESLIPRSYAAGGPQIAVGDLDGDGREDFVLGGSAGKSAQLFLQQTDGRFAQRALGLDLAYEDLGLLLFDAEGDTDLDLYVVSGGSEHWAQPEGFQDRLYRNQGDGQFRLDSAALPEMHSSGACVVAADIDRDGDLDLFVGGRVVPGQYGRSPRSYLLRNDGGHFTDITLQMSPELARIGMVSDALWTDYNLDQWPDLMLVGEWMPITLFQNREGQLQKIERPGLFQSEAWWYSLTEGDFDQDGDPDYVLGNAGLNTRLKPTVAKPLTLYAGFFDPNNSWDAIICRHEPTADGKRQLFPIHPRDHLLRQMNSLASRFPNYTRYSEAPIEAILSPQSLDSTRLRYAYTFASAYLENKGEEGFSFRPLPIEAQFSPIQDMAVLDLNEDPYPDLLLIGNDFGPEVSLGRQDASYGLSLLGDGQGGFRVLSLAESGMQADGDTRALARIRVEDQAIWLLSKNDGPLQAWGLRMASPVYQQTLP